MVSKFKQNKIFIKFFFLKSKMFEVMVIVETKSLTVYSNVPVHDRQISFL